MNDNFTLRTLITIGIAVLLISLSTSSIYLYYYMNNEVRPALNQYAAIIHTEALTRNALIRILMEKGVITKDEINAELSEITTELEKFIEERKMKGKSK